ncbi:protein containg PAS domain S-box [Longilinea arvoryzae]|uniref:Protein containg PAS domain S-box n=2 Tax=Longilinea arvoryzae TaxID=360412 RepID=A0A0S7BCV6_9CHLR|nr:protein containg PAS domain S-box [Longilinea arvoryzae]
MVLFPVFLKIVCLNMSQQPSFWPVLPACCLARSAQEHSQLIARLERAADLEGKHVLWIQADPCNHPDDRPPGRFHCLSFPEFSTFSHQDLLMFYQSTLPGNVVVLADSPNLEQDHQLHFMAVATGISPICIYRQDQIDPNRLLQVIAEHRHILTLDGWIDQLAEDSRTLEEIPEFLNGPARFRLVTNSIPYLLAYLDRDVTYRFINDPFCQWFGLPRSAILGHRMREIIGETAFENARPHIQLALAGHKTSLINHIRHADGSIHIARLTYIPDRQPDGQVRGFISSIDDITRQVEMEEQLRQSEHRLRTVITNIPIVVFTLDKDGIFTLSEGKGLQTLGLEPGQMVGQSVFEVYRGNESLLDCVRRASSGESFRDLVGDLDGHIFDTWYSPLVDGQGQQQGVLGIAADVTERTQTELALKNSEERYRALVENQDEAVLIVDAELRIEYLNLAAEGVLRRPVSQMIDQKLTDLFPPEQRAILLEQFDARKKNERSTYELSYLLPAGDQVHLLITATPRFDPNGKFQGSFAVIRDITERKLVEEDLRYRSTHDALTGLHNRFFFEEELSRLEENHRQSISMLMVDLDGLKKINDTRGHFAGDEALRLVAQLLRACLRGEDLVARLGGDEFAVLLPNTRSAEMERIIARMRRMIRKFNQRRPEMPISLSIGGATALPGASLRRALEKADQQLYEEKKQKI